LAEKVLIFGTNACPYTTAAREDYAKKGYDVAYVNVTAAPEEISRLVEHSGGRREQPVMVAGGKGTGRDPHETW